jgi:tRNA A37 threonylcarbamoyladenosine synthetase subunit TsaC/SUA5/YrdC
MSNFQLTGSLTAVLLILTPALAAGSDFVCPAPSGQTAQEVTADINGQAQTIIKLGSADIQGTIKTTVIDLYSKYPNADLVAVVSTMIYTTCSFIKNSSQLSDEQKIDKWMTIYTAILPLVNANGATSK